jgi:outer membrane protein OmpA-like peptidoglycan-associated protein
MSYSTKDKKAIRYFEEAQQAPARGIDPRTGGPDFPAAIDLLKKAVDRDDRFIEAHLALADVYEMTRNYDQAIVHFEKSIAINPNHSPTGVTYYFLASLYKAKGEYQKAIDTFDKYMQFRAANPDMKAEANNMKASCLFALDAMANPQNFDPINLGQGVNTKYPEYFPTITVDGKTILFTRRIPDNRVYGPIKEQEDFYISHLSESNIWGAAEAMPTNINTVNNEGAPTLAPDGQSLIFVACPDASGQNYGEGRYGKGSCDMFYTRRLGNRWSNPENVAGYINTPLWESQPSLSADGKTLYFIRRVQGRTGGAHGDIFVSKLQPDGKWGVAKRLSDRINTPYAEESVLIHPDGKTLYFASRGHQGMGGSDLFVSRLGADGEWGKPVNLGYPINTAGDENSLMVSADGEIAFFASDRPGGFGGLDIYYFLLPEHLRPTKTLYFEGAVFDAVTNEPLPGQFQLIDLETGEEVIFSVADPATGEFLVSLPVNKRYALNVSFPDYAFYSSNFDMTSKDGQEAVRKNVPLVPINSNIPTVLDNVFFDLSSARLRPESSVELNKLADFLSENPKVKIEIGGHTDTRGDDTDNMTLSTNRAKSVYEYLITKGIDASRLSFKGYGETQPKVSDAEIAQLSDPAQIEAAHQKNRRTEYKIIP